MNLHINYMEEFDIHVEGHEALGIYFRTEIFLETLLYSM